MTFLPGDPRRCCQAGDSAALSALPSLAFGDVDAPALAPSWPLPPAVPQAVPGCSYSGSCRGEWQEGRGRWLLTVLSRLGP